MIRVSAPGSVGRRRAPTKYYFIDERIRFEWSIVIVRNQDRTSTQIIAFLKQETMRSFCPAKSPLGLSLLFATSFQLSAQTWVGGGTTDLWSDPANWLPAGVPRQDGLADLSFFGGTENSPQADVPWAVRSLNFYGDSLSFTLGGQPVRVGQGGLVNQSSLTQTVQMSLTLVDPQIWSGERGPLVVGGSISNSGHTLFLGGAFPIALRGVISGPGSLIKKGESVLSLQAPNSFSGGVNVESGALILGDDAALGTGVFHPGRGLIRAALGRRVLANPVVMDTAEDPTFGGALDLVFSGPLSLGGNRTIEVQAGHRLEFSGAVSALREESSLTKEGEGTLVLNGAVPGGLTMPIRVGSGVLQLSKNPGVPASAGGFEIGGGNGPENSAILRWTHSDQIRDDAPLLVWRAGWMDLNGQSETATVILAGGHVTTGTGTLTLAADLASKLCDTPSTLEGRLDLGGGERLFNVVDSIPAIDVLIRAEIDHGSIIKSGLGTLVLAGRNRFAGGVVVESGSLGLADDLAAGSGPIELTRSGASLLTLAGPRQLPNPVLCNGEIVLDGEQDVTFLGPTLLTGDVVAEVRGLGRKILSGGLEERYSHRILTKRGPGELVLAGPNRTEGAIDAQAGWLTLAHPEATGRSVVRLSGASLRLGESPSPVAVASLAMTVPTTVEASLGAPGTPVLLGVLDVFQLNGTLNVKAKPGFGPGSYPLFAFRPSAANVASLKLGTLPNGFKYSLVQSKPGEISLEVSNIDPVLEPVQLLLPRIEAAGFGFSFQSQTGRSYRIESTPSLLPSAWTPVESLVGTGERLNYFFTDVTSPARFFRVITE